MDSEVKRMLFFNEITLYQTGFSKIRPLLKENTPVFILFSRYFHNVCVMFISPKRCPLLIYCTLFMPYSIF